MRAKYAILALCTASCGVTKPLTYTTDVAAEETLISLGKDAYEESMKAVRANDQTEGSSCNSNNVQVRKEWYFVPSMS